MEFLDIWKARGKDMIHGHMDGGVTLYPCLFPTSSDKHMAFPVLSMVQEQGKSHVSNFPLNKSV